MIREIIPGRQQRVRQCPLKSVTIAGTSISNVKMSAVQTWPKQKDVTSLWRHCISVRQGQRCTSAGGLSLHKYQPG